jgi:FkbM family methyltransferase
METNQLWPEDYAQGPDHCADVLRGSYDIDLKLDKPVCLDIGANVGAFARWASIKWVGATFHCYEPHPKIYDLLKRTIRDHGIQANAYNVGCSDKEEIAELSEGPVNSGQNSICIDWGTQKVPIRLIDSAALPKADVLKIDTEGCELRILHGLDRVGRIREFKAILLETHSENKRKEVRQFMKERGFTLFHENRWHYDFAELKFIRDDLMAKPDERPLVYICTPVRHIDIKGCTAQEAFESLPAHYRDPINQLLKESHDGHLAWRFEMMILQGGGVAQCRNYGASKFMLSDAEFLFFVDFDLLASAQDYVNVLSHMGENLDVCGGLYTIRKEDGHWVMNGFDPRGIQNNWGLQVMELGTGFKCYRKRALETIAKKNPWIIYRNDDFGVDEWGFFSMGPVRDEKHWPGHARWLTEDYWLDWLTRDAGIPIVADVSVQLKHKDGDKLFPAKFPPLPVGHADQKELAKSKVAPVLTGQDATS